MMPVGTDYNIGSDPTLWPLQGPMQGPMQGMAGGIKASYPMNTGTPYNQGNLDVSGYPGNQPQSTSMSMRMYRCLVYKFMCIPKSFVLVSVGMSASGGLSFLGSSLPISLNNSGTKPLMVVL